MTTPPSDTREDYYRQAESWNHDREAASRASRRVAWIAASVAALIALAEACALVALTPLKTVQPYTLLVDRQTGYVQALDPLQPARIGADTALTQSFVVQYVIARESFDIAAVQSNYKKVAAWSEGSARSRYIAAVQTSNPLSPLATLPRSTIIETRVKSVSTVGPNTLLVRFDTQRRDDGGRLRPAQPWVVVVRYRYAGEPMALADRFLDPLGFRVTHYQRSAEALVPDADPATPVRQDVSATSDADAVATAVQSGEAPAIGRTAPSPLSSVRQPGYVTQFPPAPGMTGGVTGGVAGAQSQSAIRMNRRGQPIYGPTPAQGANP